MFKGSITALVTPFKDGKLDIGRMSALLPFKLTVEHMVLFHAEQQVSRPL